MVDESKLKEQLDDFQKAVKKLGGTVNRSGIEWKDAQFKSLAESIGNVASLSKKVLGEGEQCSNAIKRFKAIESEK